MHWLNDRGYFAIIIMEEFSIKDIERLCGIKAHTIRVWEQRYGLALPHRKESQHRYYTNEDLKKILRVAWLYHQGYKISHIASISEEGMAALIDKEINNGQYFMEVIEQLILAGRQFDTEGFDRALQHAIIQLGMERAVINVFYPYLEKIGLLWMNGELLPAQEHFGTNLLRNSIITRIDALPNPEHQNPPILLFAPTAEFHEIPLLFIHFLLKKNGFRVVYFGTNVSEEAITNYCASKPVEMLHYHQVTNFTHMDADEYLEMWSTRFPQKQIVMSGRLGRTIVKVPPNAQVVGSMNELVLYCKHPYKNGA